MLPVNHDFYKEPEKAANVVNNIRDEIISFNTFLYKLLKATQVKGKLVIHKLKYMITVCAFGLILLWFSFIATIKSFKLKLGQEELHQRPSPIHCH